MHERMKNMHALPKLAHSISPHSIRIWRITNLISEIIFLIILIGLLIASYQFDWYHWITVVLWIVAAIVPLGMIWSIIFEPIWKYNYWSYGFDEHYIRFKQGRLFMKQTVIPMTKIQFVETEQGPLLRSNNVHTITIGTMGTPHKIPMLAEEDARILKEHISTYAQIKEVDA